jgi:hypothetical protein
MKFKSFVKTLPTGRQALCYFVVKCFTAKAHKGQHKGTLMYFPAIKQ